MMPDERDDLFNAKPSDGERRIAELMAGLARRLTASAEQIRQADKTEDVSEFQADLAFHKLTGIRPSDLQGVDQCPEVARETSDPEGED